MQHYHVKSLSLDGITLVAVGKDTLEAINEGTCGFGPTPLVGKLVGEFVEAITAAPGPVVVDIRDTEFIDHASVDVLFRLARLVASQHKRGFICCSAEVKKVLEVCGMNRFCPTTANVDEAITELAGEKKVSD